MRFDDTQCVLYKVGDVLLSVTIWSELYIFGLMLISNAYDGVVVTGSSNQADDYYR